jgi:ankyrin repeat protein
MNNHHQDNNRRLHAAIVANDEAEVRRLLALAPSLRTDVDEYDRSPLHRAAWRGHEGIARLLLEHGGGADVETKDKIGMSPLNHAAMRGHEGVVRLLLEHGVDVETKDNIGMSPLNRAAQYGHEGIARLLLEHGADVDAKDKYNGWSPLNRAARNGHEGVLRLLIENGADVEAKDDKDGSSPLHWSAEYECVGIVRLLFENGADVAAKDNLGVSPLQRAAKYPALLALFASPALRRLNILARRRRLPALPNEIGDAAADAAYAAQCLHVTERDVERIFLHVSDARDVAQLRLVCKTWRRLADSESVLAERPEAFFS